MFICCAAQKEIDDIVKVGYLNAIFVLARSIGLIGARPGKLLLPKPLLVSSQFRTI